MPLRIYLIIQTAKKKKHTEIFTCPKMASLKVPANVPLPEEDAKQLNEAFKGSSLSLSPSIIRFVYLKLEFVFSNL